MRTPAKLAAFAATLAVLFGVGALAGGAVDPDRAEPRAEEPASGSTTASHAEGEGKDEGHGA